MRIAALEDSPNKNGSTICHSPVFQQACSLRNRWR